MVISVNNVPVSAVGGYYLVNTSSNTAQVTSHPGQPLTLTEPADNPPPSLPPPLSIYVMMDTESMYGVLECS